MSSRARASLMYGVVVASGWGEEGRPGYEALMAAWKTLTLEDLDPEACSVWDLAERVGLDTARVGRHDGVSRTAFGHLVATVFEGSLVVGTGVDPAKEELVKKWCKELGLKAPKLLLISSYG